MRDALVAEGVPPERVIRDYAGFSTLDSIIRAQQVFLENRFIVVSQEFHIRRAIYIGKANGLDLTGFPANDVNVMHGLRTRTREHLACVKTVLDINLFHRKPHFLGEPVPIRTN
jgi:vancomycin permeability regulator SanA